MEMTTAIRIREYARETKLGWLENVSICVDGKEKDQTRSENLFLFEERKRGVREREGKRKRECARERKVLGLYLV